ncbi:MAG: hypothetical protein H6698_02895 [Myxococcales bacterium]|nr:hypothetical protein [Myxococcales bacterium]MCB9519513.1 hypothetical protein [Myxococcales bacterium]MCB9533262.1 hypothetical protein [Myxococcales bacterium]
MKLAEYQATFASVCLATEVDDAALALLGGDRERWLLYRRMVRGRLARTVRDSLPRSAQALGERFEPTVERWLASRALSSRFLRDAPIEWAATVVQDETHEAWVRDLAAYEAAVWSARDASGTLRQAVVDIDFERPTAITPTARLVWVSHAAWEKAGPQRPLGARDLVVVFRAPEATATTTVVVDRRLAVLVAEVVGRGAPIGPTGRSLAARGELQLNAPWVEVLCERLEAWMERGLVLGST